MLILLVRESSSSSMAIKIVSDSAWLTEERGHFLNLTHAYLRITHLTTSRLPVLLWSSVLGHGCLLYIGVVNFIHMEDRRIGFGLVWLVTCWVG